MNMNKFFRVFAFFSILGGFAFGANAGIMYINQHRFVQAWTPHDANFPPGGANGGPNRILTNNELGLFEGAVESHAVNETHDHMDSWASQRSTLASTGISLSGNVKADSGDDDAVYRSFLHVTFDVAETTPFSLVEGRHFDGNAVPFFGPDLRYGVKLLRVGSSAPLVNIAETTFDLPENRPDSKVIGELTPGRYELTSDVYGVLNAESEEGSYKMDFKVGEGVTAVPLPAGVWGGAGLLGMIAIARYAKRGRSHSSALRNV